MNVIHSVLEAGFSWYYQSWGHHPIIKFLARSPQPFEDYQLTANYAEEVFIALWHQSGTQLPAHDVDLEHVQNPSKHSMPALSFKHF